MTTYSSFRYFSSVSCNNFALKLMSLLYAFAAQLLADAFESFPEIDNFDFVSVDVPADNFHHSANFFQGVFILVSEPTFAAALAALFAFGQNLLRKDC